VEECTYFWGVNTSWGINTAESKRPINQEDNQAPQPTAWVLLLHKASSREGFHHKGTTLEFIHIYFLSTMTKK
jgi:hypothetical protein